jgi:hypothetical protein
VSGRDGLAVSEIMDCEGRITHRLVLEADGTVTIHFLVSGHSARIDPATRRNLTPSLAVPDEFVAHAATLTPW